jgi:glutathionyl-hydroquinone reductase
MALAITYAHSGLVERGLKELEALMSSSVRSPSQKKRRATIIRDFTSGESFRKLREMKPGDPIL